MEATTGEVGTDQVSTYVLRDVPDCISVDLLKRDDDVTDAKRVHFCPDRSLFRPYKDTSDIHLTLKGNSHPDVFSKVYGSWKLNPLIPSPLSCLTCDRGIHDEAAEDMLKNLFPNLKDFKTSTKLPNQFYRELAAKKGKKGSPEFWRSMVVTPTPYPSNFKVIHLVRSFPDLLPARYHDRVEALAFIFSESLSRSIELGGLPDIAAGIHTPCYEGRLSDGSLLFMDHTTAVGLMASVMLKRYLNLAKALLSGDYNTNPALKKLFHNIESIIASFESNIELACKCNMKEPQESCDLTV